jgi:hypothetical protein
MSDTSAYVIDMSALVQLWQPRYYKRNVFPGLWKNYDELVEAGRLVSVREVRLEVERGNDDLVAWAKQHSHLFHAYTPEQYAIAGSIQNDFPGLVDVTKETPDADPFVIAKAKSEGATVVSCEGPGTPAKPSIPYVCRKLGVRHLDLVGMFEDLGWSFH